MTYVVVYHVSSSDVTVEMEYILTWVFWSIDYFLDTILKFELKRQNTVHFLKYSQMLWGLAQV